MRISPHPDPPPLRRGGGTTVRCQQSPSLAKRGRVGEAALVPSSQRACDLFELEALDRVADLDVVVVLEGHAAFEALAHLADLVLEALQGLEAAFVDHDV